MLFSILFSGHNLVGWAASGGQEGSCTSVILQITLVVWEGKGKRTVVYATVYGMY